MAKATVLGGDCAAVLTGLDYESVQTCITSPPYYGLRDYGHDGQIGLEETPEQYVQKLVEVFRGVRRVLRADGTLWLNLGDFHGGGKQLAGMPWLVAFALQSDGWILRSDIIWAKPNPMPESVTDRPTKAHEYLFLLSKSRSYYYDADAVREEHAYDWTANGASDHRKHAERRGRPDEAGGGILKVGGRDKQFVNPPNPAGRNKRSVWTVATQPFPGAHFATFPPKLIEPCILAGSRPGDTVLDPFNGAGTTGVVALRHDRNYVGIELNPEYAQMARHRIADDAPLLNEVAA